MTTNNRITAARANGHWKVDGQTVQFFLRGCDIPGTPRHRAPPSDSLADAYRELVAFKKIDPAGYKADRRMWLRLARQNRMRALVARFKNWIGLA